MKTLKFVTMMILSLSLVACGGGGGGSGGGANPGDTSPTSPTATPDPGTATPTPAPTCTDGNASNQGGSLPCTCNTNFVVSSDGTRCTSTATTTYYQDFGAYSPSQSSTTPCQGSVTTTRLMTCRETSSGNAVSSSNCSADPSPTSSVQSRAGTITTTKTNPSLTNGYETMTCSAGATSGSRQVVCNSTYHAEGTTLANTQCVSNTRACSPLPTGTTAGTQTYASGSWGTCSATACDASSNYVLQGSSCVACSSGQYVDGGACITGEKPANLILNAGSVFQLKSNSTLISWGASAYGQLGTGFSTDRPTPLTVDVGTGLTVKKIVSSGSTALATCAKLSDSSLKCWGSNSNGLLGIGDASNSAKLTPQAVTLTSTVKDVVASRENFCVILANDSLACWGRNSYGQVTEPQTTTAVRSPKVIDVGTGLTVKQVFMTKASEVTTCVILSDNSVKCWGYNDNGQVGIGSSASGVVTPTTVSLGQGAKTIYILESGPSVTETTVCAHLLDNSLKCWGSNANGKLGSGSANSLERSPQSVSFGTGRTVKEVFNNLKNAACAVLDDNSVKCWGANDAMQLGVTGADRTAPVTVTFPGSRGVKKIVSQTSGAYCALHTDQTLSCWGTNYYGIAGLGSSVASSATPLQVDLGGKLALDVQMPKFSDLGFNTCVTTTENNLMCTGNNIPGTVGVGTATSVYYTFQAVTLPSTVKAAVIESGAVCTLLLNNEVYCWGNNSNGRLGDGTTSNKNTPTKILHTY